MQDLGGDERLVLPMAKADELEPARAEREIIVAVDVALVAVELGRRWSRLPTLAGDEARVGRAMCSGFQ